jgi:alpha-glucosidase
MKKSTKVLNNPKPEWISSGIFQSHKVKDRLVYLEYKNLKAKAGILENGTVFIENSFSNILPPYLSYAVTEQQSYRKSSLLETEDSIRLSSEDIEVVISKTAFEVRVYKNNTLIHRFQIFKVIDKEKLIIYSPRKKERFFGLGEKTGKLELTGRSFTMYNKDTYKYTKETDPVYASIPFYHALAKDYQYAVFIDNPCKMKLELNNPQHQITVYDYYSRIYIFSGETSDIITDYSELTGKPFFPPLYGFGFHQSRYSYTNQTQILKVAQNFRDNDLPLDVLYLDIGFMSNHMSFTYEPRSFPDPKQMHRQLQKLGVRTVAIVDPGIKVEPRYDVYSEGLSKNVFVNYKGKPYKGAVWPGMCHFPDFTASQTSKWWGSYYKRLLDLGISGFWNDMNEPSVFSGPNGTLPSKVIQDNMGYPRAHKYIHNIYGHSMIKATYEEVQKHTPRKRVFVLTRSGYAGLQKYAMIWTGDNTAQWDHIRMNLSMALNLGLSGVPYSGADIGGYSGSPQKELFTRWIQLATFIPFMRDHTEKGTRYQEPYQFTRTLPIIRKYMKLRYALLPYLYTQAYLSHTTGLPIVRPLWLEYGKEYLDVDEQFLYGSDLMIAPVLYRKKKKDHISVIFPHSKDQTQVWIDWHNGQKHQKDITIDYNLEDIPIYQKAGSIIPLFDQDLHSTMEIDRHTPIILVIRPDVQGKAKGILYEDDYVSTDYQSGQYLVSTFSYEQDNNSARLNIKTRGDYQTQRHIKLRLPAGIQALTVNGKNISIKDGDATI